MNFLEKLNFQFVYKLRWNYTWKLKNCVNTNLKYFLILIDLKIAKNNIKSNQHYCEKKRNLRLRVETDQRQSLFKSNCPRTKKKSTTGLTIVWPATRRSDVLEESRLRTRARRNKRSSTVDVTKMNCYIVLTNEGRRRERERKRGRHSPRSLRRNEESGLLFFPLLPAASSLYYVSGPALLPVIPISSLTTSFSRSLLLIL